MPLPDPMPKTPEVISPTVPDDEKKPKPEGTPIRETVGFTGTATPKVKETERPLRE